MVYLWNRINVLEYALVSAREDCLPLLIEKNNQIKEYVWDQNFTAEQTKKLFREIKKVSEKTEYYKWVVSQNEIENIFAALLEEATPKKWSAAHKNLMKIVKQDEEISSQKRFFNAKAYDHNQQLRTFPTTLIVMATSIKPVWFFDLDGEEKEWVDSDYRN